MSKLACFSCFFLHPWVAHFHPHISSLLMISSRVGLFVLDIFHPDPDFGVQVDIFIHEFHLFWWFHPELVCIRWLFFIQTQNFEWKWTFSSTNLISFDDFIQSWFVYIDYFSSRSGIWSGSRHFHPKISSLLVISSQVGCLLIIFHPDPEFWVEVENFILFDDFIWSRLRMSILFHPDPELWSGSGKFHPFWWFHLE